MKQEDYEILLEKVEQDKAQLDEVLDQEKTALRLRRRRANLIAEFHTYCSTIVDLVSQVRLLQSDKEEAKGEWIRGLPKRPGWYRILWRKATWMVYIESSTSGWMYGGKKTISVTPGMGMDECYYWSVPIYIPPFVYLEDEEKN